MAEKSGYIATSKFLIASPTKVRPVADVVKRKSYTEAMAILENMPHKGARLLKKTVKSAASNALDLNKSLMKMLFLSRKYESTKARASKDCGAAVAVVQTCCSSACAI